MGPPSPPGGQGVPARIDNTNLMGMENPSSLLGVASCLAEPPTLPHRGMRSQRPKLTRPRKVEVLSLLCNLLWAKYSTPRICGQPVQTPFSLLSLAGSQKWKDGDSRTHGPDRSSRTLTKPQPFASKSPQQNDLKPAPISLTAREQAQTRNRGRDLLMILCYRPRYNLTSGTITMRFPGVVGHVLTPYHALAGAGRPGEAWALALRPQPTMACTHQHCPLDTEPYSTSYLYCISMYLICVPNKCQHSMDSEAGSDSICLELISITAWLGTSLFH